MNIKIDNLMEEITRLRVDIMGLSEVRWTESGMKEFDDYTLIFSGGDKHPYGVRMMMTKRITRALLGYLPISDRVLIVKFQAKPFNVVCVQAYAPTGAHSDEDVEKFCDQSKKVKE